MTTTSGSFNNELLPLSDDAFKQIAELVYSQFGILLSDKKKALVRGRLNKMVKAEGFNSFGEYFTSLKETGSAADLLSLIDRISTNHSFFFREAEHFSFLTDTALPALCGERLDGCEDLRIWSAGGAAGQEAYTLAMVLTEYFRNRGIRWRPSILATDISISALEQATAGVYQESTMSHVPRQYKKYFGRAGQGDVQVARELRDMITFKRLNLKRDVFPFKGKFHIIFCRNVMIYFDRPTKQDLVGRFNRYTHEGGYLFIGHSESLGRKVADYSYIRPTVYRKWVNQ